MTDKQDSNKRKQKVIEGYTDYISKLRSLSLADMSNTENCKEMSILHSKLLQRVVHFLNTLEHTLGEKINSLQTAKQSLCMWDVVTSS